MVLFLFTSMIIYLNHGIHAEAVSHQKFDTYPKCHKTCSITVMNENEYKSCNKLLIERSVRNHLLNCILQGSSQYLLLPRIGGIDEIHRKYHVCLSIIPRVMTPYNVQGKS